MQHYLVMCALQRHIRQTMRYVVISAAVDRHLSQSEDVYLQIICVVNRHYVMLTDHCDINWPLDNVDRHYVVLTGHYVM